MSKYDSNGNQKWVRLRTADKASTDVTTDGLGNAYAVGWQGSVLNDSKVVLSKYDSEGELKWELYPDSSTFDRSGGISTDGRGNIYLSGQHDFWSPMFAVAEGLIANVVDSPTGDTNRDGVVDASDYVLWRDNLFNVVSACTAGDADCNGFVNNLDYSSWRTHFGESLLGNYVMTSAPIAETAEVPELTSGGLVVWGIALLVGCPTSLCRPRRD